MPDATRHRRPARPRPLHPVSPRVVNRVAAVLGAIQQHLTKFERERRLATLSLPDPLRGTLEALLDTAEHATSRHAGPGWRRRWAEDQRVSRREARIELQMAELALVATLAAAERARVPGPRRNLSPHRRTRGILPDIRHSDGGRDERPVAERKLGGSPPGGPRAWTTG